MLNDHAKKENKGNDPVRAGAPEEGVGYELGFLEKKLGLPREQVMAAIRAVGTDRKKVEAHLTRGKVKRAIIL